MNTIESLVVIALAALIHASFQLSLSMLTLLSSHTIGAKRSQARLLSLTNSFTLGVLVMTALLLSTAAFVAQPLVHASNSLVVWVAACGLLFGLGIAVWIFYYRKEQGTTLWLPRGMARYLSDRSKATKQSAEAFSLGVVSVLAELLFVFVPILVSALVLITLPPNLQLVGVVLYTALSSFPLVLISILVGGGHTISKIQRWREENKLFLQFIAGSGLIVLGFYLYVSQVVSPSVLLAAGGL